MNVLEPASEDECAAIIREARAHNTKLAVTGGGSRAGFGRPIRADAVVSTRKLTGITLYEPAEMVMSARAGTPLRDIEAALDAHGQILPFEPCGLAALYGSGGVSTIGGVAATNASGPRRVALGAARDHMLGARFVNGLGEPIKSGGRVMKNVTGLDLVKIQCGAHGTLGVLTELTFKVLPAARDRGSLMFEGLDDARAIECLCAAMGSPFEVSGAAHFPRGVGGDTARTVARVEHFPDSVAYRLDKLAATLARFGAPRRLDAAATDAVFVSARDCLPLAEPRDRAIWRLSVTPSRGPEVMAAISRSTDARWFYDWSGGLVWMSIGAEDDRGAAVIRAAVAATGGHATLMRASDETRATIDVFQPLAEPLMKLTRGLKASFDPDGVLNSGRMFAGV